MLGLKRSLDILRIQQVRLHSEGSHKKGEIGTSLVEEGTRATALKLAFLGKRGLEHPLYIPFTARIPC
jgi:hypothetical protein